MNFKKPIIQLSFLSLNKKRKKEKKKLHPDTHPPPPLFPAGLVSYADVDVTSLLARAA